MRSKSMKLALASPVVLALVVVFVARNRDRRAEIFVSEFDGMTGEMMNAMTAHPTADGVVQAHGVLNSKKDGLKAKLAELEALTAAQAGGAGIEQVDEAIGRSSTRIYNFFKEELTRRQMELDELQQRANTSELTADRYAVEKAQKENEQFREAMKGLMEDYRSIVN